MPRIELTTVVQADRATVFDACLDVGLHTASMGTSAERAIAGVTTGRLTAGDVVTWRARHFGLPWRMTVRITDYGIEFTAPMGPAGALVATLILRPYLQRLIARRNAYLASSLVGPARSGRDEPSGGPDDRRA